MCEEAERLGAHSVWLTEHHLFDDDYIAQPLVFAAAIAARTRRVRIGTAIVIAPLHSPVEIAEQSALVDVVSGGRLDLGLGAGYRVPEYELYGVSAAGPLRGDRRHGARGAPAACQGRRDAGPGAGPAARSGSATRARREPAGRACSARRCSPPTARPGSPIARRCREAGHDPAHAPDGRRDPGLGH